VTAFCHSEKGGNVNVDKYYVAGGSKRGWTTWTTAAVDKRVIAITPFVIDLLNIEKSFEHHFRAYGFWAPAIKDYEAMHIMDWTGTPQYRALMQIEEPYSYRDRLTMPKFIVNDTGDQFFLPDSSQFYFDDLKGEKHLRYVPNTDHSLKGSDARESMQAFYEMVLSGTARPKYSWRFDKDGSIRVQTMTQPTEVKLWQATNPDARDFRLEKIGAVWTSSPLEEKDKGLYVAKVEKPAKGWTAFFIEMTFPGIGKVPLKITTGVRVAPDTLPFNMPPKPAHPPKAE
jgi:PhoPQ-activated pathogenicity-related protein